MKKATHIIMLIIILTLSACVDDMSIRRNYVGGESVRDSSQSNIEHILERCNGQGLQQNKIIADQNAFIISCYK